jgi:spore germination protein YaaH
MTYLNKLFIPFLLIAFILSAVPTGWQNSYAQGSEKIANVNVNGQRIDTDVPAIVLNFRTLVPLRGVLEKLGALVEWDENEQKVLITYNNLEIILQINSNAALVNGEVKYIDVAPIVRSGRTMVPLRFIAENMGMQVNWIPKTYVATITEPTYFDNLPKNTILGFTVNDYIGDNYSYNSLAKNYSNISSIVTFSYQIDKNANLILNGESQSSTVTLANSKNVRPLLLVHNFTKDNFDPVIAHAVLSNATKRASLTDRILWAVSKEGYSGVNIDLENLYWSDRPYYSAFIKELKQKLTPYGFLTTVSIPAKTFDSYKYDNWEGAFSYNEIGKYADQILLMTYDEHYFGGEAGPVASLPWVDNVLKYATQEIPSKKLLLGIPAYGYDWSSKGNKALTLKNIDSLISSLNIQPKFHATFKSPYFTYTKNGVQHDVWYENAQSISLKLDLISTYKLGGIGIWRLGFENNDFWNTVTSKNIGPG